MNRPAARERDVERAAAPDGGSAQSTPDRAPRARRPRAPDVEAVRAAILAWYDAGHRDLPWRRTRDPYAILLSEVMLQQTQVVRVLPRWERWMDRWPTAAALAHAPLPDVLAAWVGLGYNVRARRLREACALVLAEGWPTTAAGLRALPGVGPYTAAAVASFAFGEPVAAVDTNVRRVAERLGAGPPESLLPPDGPTAARFNQAAMELGAMVCRARTPGCERCPVATAGCSSAHRLEGPPSRAPAPRQARVRFEDTDRYVRGRVVRALAEGAPLPDGVGEERLARALEGLRRDGLVADGAHGPVLAAG